MIYDQEQLNGSFRQIFLTARSSCKMTNNIKSMHLYYNFTTWTNQHYHQMDLEKSLQSTVETAPDFSASFLHKGKVTTLYLYDQFLTFENQLRAHTLEYDEDMLFEMIESEGTTRSLVISPEGQEPLKFDKFPWEAWQDWQSFLVRRIKRRNFHDLYQPIRKLGRGNFASVYLSQNRKTKELVAIKAFVKHAAYANDGKAALDNQIKMLRKSNSNYTAQLKGVYETQNSLYIAMEYAHGNSLDSYLKRNSEPINFQSRMQIIKNILKALSDLASKNIVHRDLKPDNIIVSKDLTELKLVDFGLATNTADSKYIFIRCGTPGFVAPEIIRIKDTENVRLSPISDVFSAGAIFYQMIYGKPLFKGITHSEVLNLNRSCQIQMNPKMKQQIPPQQYELLMGILEIDPEARLTASQALQMDYFKPKTTIRQKYGIVHLENIPTIKFTMATKEGLNMNLKVKKGKKKGASNQQNMQVEQ